MEPGGPQQVPDKWPATGSVDEVVDRLVAECVEELNDLDVLVHTEAAPGPDTEPVLVRTAELGRR